MGATIAQRALQNQDRENATLTIVSHPFPSLLYEHTFSQTTDRVSTTKTPPREEGGTVEGLRGKNRKDASGGKKTERQREMGKRCLHSTLEGSGTSAASPRKEELMRRAISPYQSQNAILACLKTTLASESHPLG